MKLCPQYILTLFFVYHFRFKSLNVDKEAELERYKVLAERLRPMVIESVSFLHAQMKLDKHVLVEGANAAMLDIDFGKSFFITGPKAF